MTALAPTAMQEAGDEIEVVPLSEALGAEVRGVDLSAPIAPRVLVQITDAWSRHLVLRFRDQQAAAPRG